MVDYEPYSAYVGSFYCGGNRGSMKGDGLTSLNLNHELMICNKFVGGSNNADIAATEYNAAYAGGVIGDPDSNGNKLELNFDGLMLQPMRWKMTYTGKDKNGNDYTYEPTPNTADGESWNDEDKKEYIVKYGSVPVVEYNVVDDLRKRVSPEVTDTGDDDEDTGRRFVGGNIYGGCYESGHVNGNVVINLKKRTVNKNIYGAANVDRDDQFMDVLQSSLSLYAGGYGEQTEIWGSTTVNISGGYTPQVFGGGEMGVVGKKDDSGKFVYNKAYSTKINLCGPANISENELTTAECDFIYGGGFQGLVTGNTRVNLGNGLVWGAFGGACAADILGHTETYVGRNSDNDEDLGIPYMRNAENGNDIYGGNDLSGKIWGGKDPDPDKFANSKYQDCDFSGRLSDDLPIALYNDSLTIASAYIEYVQGVIGSIYGGNYGGYDYSDEFAEFKNKQPWLESVFINFKPSDNNSNVVEKVFGGSEGINIKNRHEKDRMQDRSYVLVDIKDEVGDRFKQMEVFGAGENGGIGMGVAKTTADLNADSVTAAAVIDLARGEIGAAYGGSLSEGVTRRSIVNVPTGSSVKVKNLFAGAFGADYTAENGNQPCDVYEGTLNYSSEDATVTGALYGGNNNNRRTLYGKVNVNSPVWSDKEKGLLATVYGAGKGGYTWSEYTEVNLNDGARVYEVYGGGEMGCVVNKGTVEKLVSLYSGVINDLAIVPVGSEDYTNYYINRGLASPLAKEASDFGGTDPHFEGKKFNTNVLIHEGATVVNYAYGGGLGDVETPHNTVELDDNSGNVFGTTYIALLGGTVMKDIYGAGTVGSIINSHEVDKDDLGNDFIASSNVYIQGGTCRNVYGGGWNGAVGFHKGVITNSIGDDILGETNVYIGKENGTSFIDGIPAIQRNAYGGGEGGPVWGTSHITLRNGYIGYEYADGTYTENIEDKSYYVNNEFVPNDRLKDSGNIFGGGYIDNSSVDYTNVFMYGGTVRGCLFGGGEIAAVGRGDVKEEEGSAIRVLNAIYDPGSTYMEMYGGKVLRDVFGGGRGYNNLGMTGSLYTDGYVFGKTEVHIRGGEIGSKEGIAQGYGNVFGGGDIGYVYSGNGTKVGERGGDESLVNGVPADGGGFYFEGGDKAANMTEDCKVVIEPWCKVTGNDVTYNGKTYAVGDYVPQDILNTLKKDDDRWENLDETGVTIYNAVFAGGNVSAGSDRVYANAVTVFGNATAAVRDIYSHDLISIGGEHVGGIYGDGNLTLVDGYRELHIANYGTDFYRLSPSIDETAFENLNPREQAYYKLNYKCVAAECTDNAGHKYHAGDELIYDELLQLFEGTDVLKEDGTPKEEYWVSSNVKNIYEGRLINTIQRADMVGVFGSRLVLQGAQDRVPSVADYTNYTINRVGEVSLNQVTDPTNSDSSHGNYFGIYNIVNYLGNLTSDVFFSDTRITDSDVEANQADGVKSYYDWKLEKRTESNRNNGTSPNKVALAAGVYLEITRESGEGKDAKDWGYITGVIQLDLIDVQTGLGGGYVYAKNEHGVATHNDWGKVILSEFNNAAVTYKKFTYATATQAVYIETSGNFVHNAKRIVDDCYPVANKYYGDDANPAHYWYIKGDVYIYDEYISAYTGTPNAYAEAVNIPLTISATSRGKITLKNVQPNLYATQATTVTVNGLPKTFLPGDAIDWWSYSLLNSQTNSFAKDIYTVVVDCKIGGTAYTAGTVLTQSQRDGLKNLEVSDVADNPDADFDFVVRHANNVADSNGYVLTNKFDNPEKWYFSDPAPAPSFSTSTAGIYGQRNYGLGEIVYGSVVDNYNGMDTSGLTDQATMEEAFVVTAELKVTDKNGMEQHLFPGAPVVRSNYEDAAWNTISGKVALAKVVTSTLKLSDTDYLYVGSLVTEAEVTALIGSYPSLEDEINNSLEKAWYCTSEGLYGGSYFNATQAYPALESWCSLSPDDRSNFTFNYDALNVLIDEAYQGVMSEYDGTNDPKVYSVVQPIDYQAEYLGEEALTWTDENRVTQTIEVGSTLTREQYEAIPNEQEHYVSFSSTTSGTYYIVTNPFERGETSYPVGKMIEESAYNEMNEDQQSNFKSFNITEDHTNETFYFCAEPYTVNEHGEGYAVTDLNNVTYSSVVPIGTIIDEANYNYLPNKRQGNFNIYGPSPLEESTLYVTRKSDIYDLSKERIITVVYQYDYQESDESGMHIVPVSERHVINIHINFKTGVPQIGELMKPSVVLPGSTIGLKIPTVTPGAFEVTNSGWEIFSNINDADNHINGQPYYNNLTPLYWYQNDYRVAYYTQTYLGKTYSNHVPFTVANYHDLRQVMEDKSNHYFIDHEDAFKERDPKIYINAPKADEIEAAGAAGPKNRLDILKDLFDLSVFSGSATEGVVTEEGNLKGHALLDERVKGCANLDIIMRTNVDHPEAWTSIANEEGQCFEGTFHGDGYYISGLNNSLFGNLCGSVYNLGVMGSFTTAGVALKGSGYAENCWVMNTQGTEAEPTTMASGQNPIIGEPTRSEGTQIVNCYYPTTNNFNGTTQRGTATQRPLRAFYNGEVAYDLNGFYLNKRYNDGINQASGLEYQYWKPGSDELQTGHYDSHPEYCSSGYNGLKYVEDRYGNVDFIYAGGTIPEGTNIRLKEGTTDQYYPIWPDDYIFFGQALTYGWDDVNLRAHQDVPSHINQSGERLQTGSQSNRVYRAPAYFRSKEMGVAHFNPYAIFAQSKKGDANVLAYKNMTAIDFTGGNGDWAGGYELGLNGNKFYAPLLDDDGLTGFVNADLTQNLLAYTGTAAPAKAQTDATVNTALPDPTYSEDVTYRAVDMAFTSSIRGHQVTWNGSSYTTTKDHLLVDKNDFNAPIQYTMGSGKRMWYQRNPDLFVDRTKGWEGISIPFTAELVTTNQKGEITHFYAGSQESKNGTRTKIGHEVLAARVHGHRTQDG